MGGGRTQWDPWYRQQEDGKVECKFCKTKISYRKDRLLFHLGYKRNDTLPGVRMCNKASATVKAMFFNCGGNVPTVPDDEEEHDVEVTSPSSNPTRVVRVEELPIGSISISGGGGNTVGQSSQVRSSEAPVPSSAHSRPLRQLSVQEGMDTSKKQVLDKKWAKFFYEANIPFNVVRHPAFVDAVKSTSESRVTYKPPPYNAIRTKLMTSTKEEVEALVAEKTKGPIHKYGVTICSDGWDNVTHRPLINVMLSCTSGEVFLGSVDTTGESKDAVYVANRMIDYIDAVGGHNVVQVCTDNAPNMRVAGARITREFPHLYFQGCSAHALDLLLEDWGKQQWVVKMVKKAKTIVKFIRLHHMPLAIFRRHSPNLMLKNPIETRFATVFLMIERLAEVKEAVESTVHDQQWIEYVRSQPAAIRNKAEKVRRRVRKDEFWRRCLNFVHMVEPVLVALREFDGKHPVMGKAWMVMKKLEKHVLALRNPPFSLEDDYADRAETAFYERWDLMKTDLHYAAALLNPFLLDEIVLIDDNEAREAVLRVLRKLAVGEFGYATALFEYQSFRDRRGIFSGLPDVNTLNLEPHEWWDLLGAGAHTLAPIARRILAQVCSASSCERNWSMYSFVHSKSRNRLTSERAEELVYIYTNSRTLRERGAADAARWYTENMLSEDSMTDESNGFDRGSVMSDAHNDDSDDSSDGDDGPPFRRLGERQQRGPLIDESVFDFDGANNDGDDHMGDEDGNDNWGDEGGNDNGGNDGGPPWMPHMSTAGSSGGNQNEGVEAPPSSFIGPIEQEMRTLRHERVVAVQMEIEDEVVATQPSVARSSTRHISPIGVEIDFRTPCPDTIGVRRQTPILDDPPIQNSVRPSSSSAHPNQGTPSIGTRLAGLFPTLNMTARRNATPSSEQPDAPPTRTTDRRSRPREEGPAARDVNRRIRRRIRREEAGSTEFIREGLLPRPAGPSVDTVGDAGGGRPIRRLASIVGEGSDNLDSSPSEANRAASDHDDDSIGASIDEDGEVPGDSDYRGTRGGPPLAPQDNQATTRETAARSMTLNRRRPRN